MATSPQRLSFSDLDDDARERVIESARYIEVECANWYQETKAEFVRAAARKGFDIDDCRFSGFSCQGDGASFKGSVDIEIALRAHRLSNRHRKALRAAKKGDVSARIVYGDSRYCHSYTMSLELDWPGCEDDAAFMRLEEELLAAARAVADGYYSDLEDLYDHLTSDEAVAERLEADDRAYDEDGNEVDEESGDEDEGDDEGDDLVGDEANLLTA